MATFIHRALNPASPDPQQVVRVLYAVPSDRDFRSDYSQAIRRTLEHVRFWYQQQLDGPTFSLNSPDPREVPNEPTGGPSTPAIRGSG